MHFISSECLLYQPPPKSCAVVFVPPHYKSISERKITLEFSLFTSSDDEEISSNTVGGREEEELGLLTPP